MNFAGSLAYCGDEQRMASDLDPGGVKVPFNSDVVFVVMYIYLSYLKMRILAALCRPLASPSTRGTATPFIIDLTGLSTGAFFEAVV